MTNKDGGEKKKKQNCKKFHFEEEFVRVVDSGSWCYRLKMGCDKNFDKKLLLYGGKSTSFLFRLKNSESAFTSF